MADMLRLTEEIIDATVEKGGTLFITFGAASCEFSQEFAPIFEAAATKHPKVAFGMVDIDAQEVLADDFEIEGTPTLIAIRDGVVVAREEGAMPAAELDEVVAEVGALDMDFIRSELSAEVTKVAKKPAGKKPAAKKAVVKKPVVKKAVVKKAAAKKPAAKKVVAKKPAPKKPAAKKVVAKKKPAPKKK